MPMQTHQKSSSSRTTCSVDWRVARDGDFYFFIHDQITNLYLSRCKKPLLFVAVESSQTKQVMTCPLPQADLPAVSLRIFIPLSSSCFLFHLELLLLHLFRQDADSRVKNIRCAAECPCEPPPLPQCKVSQTQLCRQKRRSRPPVRGVSFTPPPPLTLRRQFLRHHAPALAYANPLLPIGIHRIPDPRSKHKDPNSPDREAVKLGRWGGVPDGLQLGKGNVPGGEMVVEFRMFFSSPSYSVSH